MPIKQNPFSLYDFLGYLLPGALFLHSLSIIFPQAFSALLDSSLLSLPSTYQIALTLIAAYLGGHIIGVISSYTIETSYIRKNGHPSRKLLKHEEVKKENTHRAINRLWDFQIFLAESISKILANNPSFKAKALDDHLIEMIERKINHYFEKDHKSSFSNEIFKDEYFHHIYHYCVEHSNNHLPKIQNYVALYGLMRNAACVCLITAWGLLCTSLNFKIDLTDSPSFGKLCFSLSTHNIYLAIAYLTAYSIMYLGFTKFYRRYSSEVIMAFSVTYKYSDPSHESLRRHIKADK